MEPYFEEHIFTEELVVLPSYLNSNLLENLTLLLTQKYPRFYQKKGFIFNIKIIEILDNKITLSGQIILKLKFKATLYIPKLNDTFQSYIKKSNFNKHQWVEIGPLTIFLVTNEIYEENQLVKVKITNIKSDNTLCFGQVF